MNIYTTPQFFNPDVGGSKLLNVTSTQHQLDVLNMSPHKEKQDIEARSKIRTTNTTAINEMGMMSLNTMQQNVETDDKNKYDPIADWEDSQGLTRKSRSRLTANYLHIDSSLRQINPVITQGEFYTLLSNPITSTVLNNNIFISHPNHSFNIGDKITIDGLAPVNHQLLFDPSIVTPLLQFFSSTDQTDEEYSYIQVNYPHGIPEEYSDDSYLTNLYCEIQGFTNKQTPTNTFNEQFYGDIPLTFVNKVHSFFLKKELTSPVLTLPYSPNCFYIELPYKYQETPGVPSTATCYINLLFYFINGIPLNQINAKYPVDIYHSSSYQVISQVTSAGYYITLNTTAFSSGSFGGLNVQIGTVADFRGGYVEPNQYTVDLEKTYKNIVKVKLCSTEFPNSEYVIKDYPPSSANNKIYWQNYDDGSYTYSISITPGKYNPSSLTTAITKLFYDTPRQYYPNPTQNYTNNNYITMNIDTDSDKTTFSSYRQSILRRAIYGVYYIDSDGLFKEMPEGTLSNPDPPPEYIYPVFVLVNFPFHGIILNYTYQNLQSTLPYIPDGSVGDQILISNALAYMGITADKLNGQFEAYAPSTTGDMEETINSRDYFMYLLQPFDMGQYPTTSRDVHLHGGIFNVYVPNKFRMLFDKPDTIGSILGFPNCGESYAVTKFADSITNKDPYQPDINPIMVSDTTSAGNAIMMSGYNYILMVCNQFPVLDTIGKIKSAFAKINLVGIPGKMVYNTFVSTPKDYYEPIGEVSQLTFSFYTPSGELYDFNGIDHSFTLEITTLDDLPQDTNINPQTGRIIV